MTNKEQIKVIEKVKARLNETDHWFFLCTKFDHVLDLGESIMKTSEDIAAKIPLFTKENAQQFADPEYPMDFAWWTGSDKERRMQFLNWIIEQLESQQDEDGLPEDNFIMNGF